MAVETTKTRTPEELARDPHYMAKRLQDALRLCPAPDAQARVTAHIFAVTGKPNMVAFVNNGAPPDRKIEVLAQCLQAVAKNDFSRLQGTVPAGQTAAVEATKPAAVPVPDIPALPTPAVEAPPAKPEPMAVTPRAVTPAAPGLPQDRSEALGKLLELLAQPAPVAAVQVDQAELARVAGDIVRSEMKSQIVDMRGIIDDHHNALSLKIDAYLDNIPPRDVVEIRKWDGTVKEIGGLRHKQFPTILKTVTARTASGWPVPCWWYGAPGAGKTHLWGQVAEAVGAAYHPIPLGPTTTEGKLIGYRNLATGQFVNGLLYEPYKNGGFVNLDEIDCADASVLVGVNSLVANSRFLFPNGELVPRHREFYIVASANTIGTGAMGGFTRNKLDAATLDRFAKFRLEYDRDLEAALCGNAKWAEYVWRVREHVEANCSQSIYITPRASINGAALLANGVPPEMVVESTLFAMMSKDTKATVAANVGGFTP